VDWRASHQRDYHLVSDVPSLMRSSWESEQAKDLAGNNKTRNCCTNYLPQSDFIGKNSTARWQNTRTFCFWTASKQKLWTAKRVQSR
jgi:hypothetical protein